ncbi:NAD(P)-binding oxidoreductase [Xylocopilactobacillus apis]|uniref:Oxidoreductase n=1 Tax=Xylocopilactobacillus apis TaxID=2932183 RepID=A0AAU9DQL0_9LACO|nr:NAD(P)-binding oxidoreductase [Xylocopilactobacillus apis]BDR57398.1 oxidoreductase [Xylocopilactobacillus apis]
MKFFIIGANGRIGKELCNDLLEKGHVVTAAARHFEQLDDLKGLTKVKLDLNDNAQAIAKTMTANPDVIYFVAGSRGNDLLNIDTYGAVKSMQAAEINHIKRFVMLSGYGSLTPSFWEQTSLKEYYTAKYFADNWLISNTNLDYTILQPGTLTEKPLTGKVSLNTSEAGENSIKDVAAVLAAIPEHKNTNKKIISMHDGSTPIDEALKEV